MTSQHHIFGVTRNRPSRREANLRWRIARKHDGWFTEVNLGDGDAPGINGGAYQGWFEAPDQASQQSIERELMEATR
jgi:hypothetical protein